MDFMKILRSLEEFLYELLSWFLFYPRTMLRIIRNPAGVSKYIQLQMQQPAGEQFLAMVSPVLTLILSILITHGIEMTAHVVTFDQLAMEPVVAKMFSSYQGLLLARGAAYGLYSLVAAVWVMSQLRIRIDRNTLREPFFIQAYLVSPFTMGLSIASVLVRRHEFGLQAAGVALAALITVWYLWAQTTTYCKLLRVSAPRALAYAVSSFVAVTLFLLGIGLLLIYV